MAGKGRPKLYDSKVKPHLKEIEEMAQYMTEEQIAETLGIGYSTFNKYKNEQLELKRSLVKGKRELVKNLKSTLIQKAKGYDYVEVKETEERDKETGELVIVKRETTYKRAHADVASINLLLKNLDKDNWANDPQLLDLRKEELEFHKEKLKKSEW